GQARDHDVARRPGDLAHFVQVNGREFAAQDLLRALLVVQTGHPDFGAARQRQIPVTLVDLGRDIGKAVAHDPGESLHPDRVLHVCEPESRYQVPTTRSLERPDNDVPDDQHGLPAPGAALAQYVRRPAVQHGARFFLSRGQVHASSSPFASLTMMSPRSKPLSGWTDLPSRRSPSSLIARMSPFAAWVSRRSAARRRRLPSSWAIARSIAYRQGLFFFAFVLPGCAPPLFFVPSFMRDSAWRSRGSRPSRPRSSAVRPRRTGVEAPSSAPGPWCAPGSCAGAGSWPRRRESGSRSGGQAPRASIQQMSASLTTRKASPSITTFGKLRYVPLPKHTRSPTSASTRTVVPMSVGIPGPTATTSPRVSFSSETTSMMLLRFFSRSSGRTRM